MFKLIIEDDEGKTTVVPLIRDEITIGRKEGNTIRLTERNVSRRHAKLLKQNGAVFIEDLTSYNGIKLNGVRIGARTPIGEGDHVTIGDYKLAVKFDRPAVAPMPVATPGVPSPNLRATALGVAPSPLAGPGAPEVAVSEHPTVPNLRPLTPPLPLPALGASAPLTSPGYQAGPAAGYPAAPVAQPPPAAPVYAPPPVQSFVAPAAPHGFPAAPPPAAFSPPSLESSVPGPIEGSPTIPVRTLADQGLAGGEPGMSPPARLVALTTDLAGAEFFIDRPSVVIGRTDENDIVLNHRSISRHHAKIVRDGERYTVVDLQSANGVRVNGSGYERVELNPGDTLELGHVRIRFVGGNEAFVFDPMSVRSASRLPTKPMLLVGAGAIVAIAVVMLFVTSSPEKPKSKLVEVKPASTPTAVVTPAPTPAPTTAATEPPAPAEPAKPAGEPTMALLAKAAESAKAEGWDEALATLGTILAREPGETRARDLHQKYEAERKNGELFAKFKAAADGKEYEEAILSFTEITEDSIYKDKGRRDYQQVRGKFISKHLESAEKLRSQGKCAEVRQEAELVLAVDEKNRLAQEVMKMCKPRAGSTVTAREPSPPPSRKEPASRPRSEPRARPEPPPRAAVASRPAAAPPRPAPPDEPAVDPQALVKQAREAWVRGQHAAAIEFANKALKARPALTDAYQIIAVASCSLRDSERANRAYVRLDDKSKQMVRSLCSRNGITME